MLPADANTVYWTGQNGAAPAPANSCSPQRVLTIRFAQPVSSVIFTLGVAGFVGADTITVTDDGGDNIPYSISSAQSVIVQLPAQGIRQITLAPQSTNTWSYFLDKLTYSAATPSIALLDPVPQLVSGNAVVTDVGLLAGSGTPVAGVGADSAAQVVIRIYANSVGEQLTLSLMNDQGAVSNSQAGDGQLTTVDGRHAGSQLQLTAVNTPQGLPMAFALYTPPADFVRQSGASIFNQSGNSADLLAATRTLTLKVVSATVKSASSTLSFTLARPPVTLVHGIWGAPSNWDSFSAVVADQRFPAARATYDEDVTARVLSTSPAYPGLPTRASALGLAFNAPGVAAQIGKNLLQFRRTRSLAAAQTDVVAHSMGALVVRQVEHLSGYAGADSFGSGNIHKLIAIGAPYLGTPVALQLLNSADTNACTRNSLGAFGNPSILTATVDSPANAVSGAVADLRGDGWGDDVFKYANLGALLIPAPHAPPTAVLAGKTQAANLASLTCPSSNSVCWVRTACSSNPLAQDYSPAGWNAIFGQDNDGFVPILSQAAGALLNTTMFSGLLHSTGMEGASGLGFTGPAELDSASAMQAAVVQLLNAGIRSLSFLP